MNVQTYQKNLTWLSANILLILSWIYTYLYHKTYHFIRLEKIFPYVNITFYRVISWELFPYLYNSSELHKHNFDIIDITNSYLIIF